MDNKLAGVWQPLGLFDSRLSHRQDMPYVLCEGCFRQATSSLSGLGSIMGDIGRCVVSDVAAVRPKSFLGIYYGRKAEKNEFKGTTGEHVKIDMLDSLSTHNLLTKNNSFMRNDKTNEVMNDYHMYVFANSTHNHIRTKLLLSIHHEGDRLSKHQMQRISIDMVSVTMVRLTPTISTEKCPPIRAMWPWAWSRNLEGPPRSAKRDLI
jgi:hypothetical protein